MYRREFSENDIIYFLYVLVFNIFGYEYKVIKVFLMWVLVCY